MLMNPPRFIESIRVCNGAFCSLEWHLHRMRQTAAHWQYPLDLSLFPEKVPEEVSSGVFKCRIVYDTQIREITYSPYQPRMIRSLKLVDGGTLDYTFKYEDRSALMRLTRQKGICDDVLITKDGYITDTSYSNVVLENSEGLFVPHTCLLNGTRRQRLLTEGIVQERPIRPADLNQYNRLYLINALIGLEENISLPVSAIDILIISIMKNNERKQQEGK